MLFMRNFCHFFVKAILGRLKSFPKSSSNLFTETATQKCSSYFFFKLFDYGKGNTVKIGVVLFQKEVGLNLYIQQKLNFTNIIRGSRLGI